MPGTLGLRQATAAAALAIAALVAPLPASAAPPETLVIDIVNEPSSLDPHMQWNPDSYYVYRNIFDNLLTRTDEGEIAPQIATEWTYVSDTEIAFTIRDDVTFHDGTALTPEDVVFSVERITDPEFGSPQLGQFSSITGAEVTGDNEVTLTTETPYPALLAQLVKLSIVPKAHVEEVGTEAFNLAPVGSGPYAFDEWQRGVQVTLTRNDAYWGDTAPFAAAEFRAVPDAATRVANLQAGQSHLVVSLDPDLALQLQGAAGVEVRDVLTERVGYLNLNAQKPGLDDVELRRAVAMAIDKELIVEGLLGGFDAPIDSMITEVHAGYGGGVEGVPYDPEAAREIIEGLGEAADREFSFATSPVFDQRIVQALQQMLTDVGLDVSIEMTDMSTYLSKVRSAPADAPDMSFGRWSCACQDADGVLYPLLDSDSSWSKTRDETFDRLLSEARNTLDETERQELYHQVNERVAELVPFVPLYRAAILYGADANLVWQPTPNESMFLNRMDWSE
ncbi:ABC transporter substrate-binding protein [Roseivivax isoporae]|uniref:Peptide ABC transporter n=1 Tax=Roseivivax isoporae LMG 25204 TaxID=1449351 RepID=X7FAZ3_9RHOB|nr:ABC transporter substrate-binding protein [Roseivivax isoporae]ETX29893.1 peptide ABC transporter [Roseivivax isoporae LMG 25204]